MRNRRTLFIVGAGASKEVGLPIGRELVEIVASRLNFQERHGSLIEGYGDADILDIFQQYAHTREGINAFLDAARRVRDGVIFSNSVDSFIDVHREDRLIQLCGKLAIVKTILKAERQSKLFIDRRVDDFADLEGLKKTWFFDFARHLNDGIRREEVERIFEKVAFIIFNYDRCFEHFVHEALQRHFGIASERASSIMKTLKIIHPYGTVANLPWVDKRGIPFGFTANRSNMQLMASSIKTYTEQVEAGSVLQAIREEVLEADTLVFLGFSYHPENMKLLSPGRECKTERVYGTALGVSESNVADIIERIRTLIGRHLFQQVIRGGRTEMFESIYIQNLECSGLLQEYSRSLFSARLLDR
jgi:hypothetical protein